MVFNLLKVKLERSLQALLVTIWPIIIVFGAPASVLFVFGVLLFGNSWMRLLMIGYLAFCFFDFRECQRGGRRFGRRWFRNCFLWRYYADYFPIRLVKTAEIDPTKNSIYCSYPHGVYVTGAMTAFNTGALNCTKLFPGIDFRMCTLDENFWCPLFREFMYIQGSVSCDAKSLDYLLSTKPDENSGPTEDPVYSRGCVLIVGGGAEAAVSRPGNYAIVLKRRKGFVRMALKHGASLVPVYSFGENDIFDGVANGKGSRLRSFQEFLGKYLMIPILPISQGFKPNRKPITVIVGSAIEIPKIENPTQEDIDKHHERFIEGIVSLFETHKSKYIENYENVSLILE